MTERVGFAAPAVHDELAWDGWLRQHPELGSLALAQSLPEQPAAYGVAAAPAERPAGAEAPKSFDVLASVHMLRADLARFGQVLPETRQRIRDEELSLVSEGMDRAARTEFALKRQGNDLVYYKNGKWESYTSMLLTGRDVATKEAGMDPRKQFLAEDAVRDYSFGLKMRALKPGQQLVWASPYRQDIESRYGATFMRSCGRFPHRKMGFLYRARCEANGTVVLESQTIDRSDAAAIAAALAVGNQRSQANMDSMLAAHDAVLASKYNRRFYAGRTDVEMRENAWHDILRQEDLIAYFLHKLEAIAASPLQGAALETAVKRHVYGVWAAIKQRLDGTAGASHEPRAGGFAPAHLALMEREVEDAFTAFAQRGVAMVGCGGEISILQGEHNILNADGETVFGAIFGKPEEDQYGPLVFKCTKGHRNKRKRGQLLAECQTKPCEKGSVGCG